MTDSGALGRLATLAGIEPAYHDIWGTRHEASEATKRALLKAMGFAADTDAEAAASLETLETEEWRRPLPHVLVTRVGQPITVRICLPTSAINAKLAVEIVEEGGRTQAVTCDPSAAPLADQRRLDGVEREQRMVTLQVDLPPGYHTVQVPSLGSDTMRLIVAPRASYLPSGDGSERAWGLTVHLYALKSPRSWGVGDYSDLAELAEGAGRHGAATLGINPLHALYPAEPERASPYSPSTRLFLNPLYIDVEAVPEFAESKAAQDAAAEMAEPLNAVKSAAFVDYTAVSELKLGILELLFAEFRRMNGNTPVHAPRVAAFGRFQEESGEHLRRFAEFEALSESFEGQPWTKWPEAYRDPAAPAVRAFVEERAERVLFHMYLQFLSDEQLAATQKRAQDAGMTLGLYRDLAVGVDVGGSDGWSDQSVIVTGASVGAPPDPFNMLGQDWGMPPLSPHGLREASYEPFIAMVRANMRHAGALRIDHAMGLMHLFCIPAEGTAADGAYLEYPFDDLLGIVALESQRQKCVVIGEDLGTVPEGFRERMASENILSYRVLYFEKDGDRFKRPDEYPALALACVTTHDLAPLAGFWSGADILLRKRLDLYPSPSVEQSEWESRQRDRESMLRALAEQNLISDNPDHQPRGSGTISSELVTAIHAYLGRSPARYVIVQLDDISMEDVQINLPGTVDEHANWRRRLSAHVEELLHSPLMASIASVMADRHVGTAREK